MAEGSRAAGPAVEPGDSGKWSFTGVAWSSRPPLRGAGGAGRPDRVDMSEALPAWAGTNHALLPPRVEPSTRLAPQQNRARCSATGRTREQRRPRELDRDGVVIGWAELECGDAIDPADAVELLVAEAEGAWWMWLTVDGAVRASARVVLAG